MICDSHFKKQSAIQKIQWEEECQIKPDTLNLLSFLKLILNSSFTFLSINLSKVYKSNFKIISLRELILYALTLKKVFQSSFQKYKWMRNIAFKIIHRFQWESAQYFSHLAFSATSSLTDTN